MLNAKTGNSTAKDAANAGREAASMVKDGNPKMAFVYSGVQYNQKELIHAIKETLPGVPLIGNTSFTGVITPDGFIGGNDGFVGIMALGDDAMTVGVAGMPKHNDARTTGRAVAKAALKKAGKTTPPDYFYMSAPPGEEETYLKGIEDIIGRVPFFGGSAADNAIAGEWLLYTDEMITPDGVSVAFFYTDKAFANKFTGAYHETENVGVITKLNGPRTLVEIDGVPAVKKFAQWTGQAEDKLMFGNLLVTCITQPLGVKDRLGDLVAVRHPMNGNNDYSMAVGNNMAVGTAVIQLEATIDELIQSVGNTLEVLKAKIDGPIGALHLVHCGGRRAGID
ncbi:MAG: FIST N-terminal domain-containing protein, partial [Anaerovoracaceae bacterium]